MTGKLKQFRVNAGMTQTQAAQKVGVSQPNYQRWESGAAPIPDDKLKKLARAFKTSPAAILGRLPPIETAPHDDSVGEDLRCCNEVSVHFCGGGEPLLLSISEGEFRRLHAQLQEHAAFVTLASLANQTVAIRTRAIADLHLASEAHDHGVQITNPRDWEIVEALAGGDVEEFDPADVDRVTDRIMITDDETGQKETAKIFDLATQTMYQLSSGQQRRMYVDAPEMLFGAFYELTDSGGGDPTNIIVLPAERSQRTIFINKDALDYVMFPTHQYLQGRTDAESRKLDSGSDQESAPVRADRTGQRAMCSKAEIER